MNEDDAGIIDQAWELAMARLRRESDATFLGRDLMTGAEHYQLFHALLHGHAGEQMSADELVAIAVKAIGWARHVRLQAAVLDAVLRGEMLIRWEGEEPRFAWPQPAHPPHDAEHPA